MNRQAVFNWLKQRPWLIVPVLGIVPLIGIPLINQTSSTPETATVSPSPLLPTASITLPTIAQSPLSTPQPSPKASPQPAQKSAQPAQVGNVQAVQSAINLSVDAAIQMRVLIHEAASRLSVGTSTGGAVFDVQSNRVLYELPANSSYEMQADGNTILLGALKLPSLIWIDPSPTGVTFVGDRGYRGRILVATSENRIWVVNYVNLQQYLYSVVGSEVSPSWPMEALKAQAVAARSYALTYHLKPVKKDLYDLGSDEYYQVYKGISTEANSTRRAVNTTSGEFVSYRGGVVESLYAATDDIVMEAFQGRGMSQIGALGLAEQGQNYRQILSAYYAGTGIGRIEMDIE
ncbi:MAG: SpoIID/LytB domain-containing protein [Oscillatoriales cyanobacterium C42_A2020_001]|nr:SpoIID/LytB domain-containing protein [Leptolyngbyaceae cyanobacterium C42_A2020_001]